MAKKKGLMKHKHDIFDRIKGTTSDAQIYDAHAVIGRLRDDGYKYFEKGSASFEKWEKECLTLNDIVRKFSHPEQKDPEKRIVLLEESIDQFEHAERRFRQVLAENPTPESYQESANFATDFWLGALFRFFVYAILLERKGKRRTPPFIRMVVKLPIPPKSS